MPELERHLGITDRELFARLGWFTRIRWAFGVLAVLMLLASRHLLGARFLRADGSSTLVAAAAVAGCVFLYNAVFILLHHGLRVRGRITRRRIMLVACGQLGCDLAATLLLVHFTGGVENHFLVLILLPLAIATELLPQRLAYVMAGVTALAVHALAWGELQGAIPHVNIAFPSGPGSYAPDIHTRPLHVLHVTTAITVTLFALVAITSTIASRLRNRESELETAYLRLRQADQAKSFFMRRAEHEMRAPLAAAHSILDAIRLELPDGDPTGRPLIERAQTRLRALMGLVEDLRHYSRLQAPERQLEMEPVRLGTLARQTVDLYRKHAEQARLELRAAIDEASVPGDEEMLHELVTNLLANAVQYTPAGGSIELVLRTDGTRVRLRVADTGIGISPAARERLFEEFYRAPEAKRVFAQGTGLGLAIVKRIVDLHGGRLTVEDRPGGGTVFAVDLPAAQNPAPATAPACSAE